MTEKVISWGSLGRCLVALLVLLTWGSAFAAEVRLPELKTRSGTYSNVMVTSQTETDIMITHDRGFGNVKVSDIEDDAALIALGYKTVAKEGDSAQERVSSALADFTGTNQPLQELMNSPAWERLKQYHQTLENKNGLIALGVGLAVHLFLSFCLKLICVKAGYEPGFLIWLPGFQVIPVLRAARMSLLWLLPPIILVAAMLGLPLLLRNTGESLMSIAFMVVFAWTAITVILCWICQIIWCFKITAARGKSVLVAIALLLPLLNLFAILYLAFSGSPEPEGKISAGR